MCRRWPPTSGTFWSGRGCGPTPSAFSRTARRLAANYRAAIALVLAYLVMRMLLLIFAGA